MNLKARIKKFFNTDDASSVTVQIVEKFIMPFAAKYDNENYTVDRVVHEFFSPDIRKFVVARAKVRFNIKGRYFVAGARAVYGLGERRVDEGTQILIGLDKEDMNARVQVSSSKEDRCFLLNADELRELGEYIEITGTPKKGPHRRSRNYGT